MKAFLDNRATFLCPMLMLLMANTAVAQERGPAWGRHVIDDSSHGADGVRLTDVNGDGLLDITTGWEEGGIVRVYRHPGHQLVRNKWPAVTVGRVVRPEDAVFADLDGDGAVDVISSCEGRNETMFVHWAPGNKRDYFNEQAWKTAAIPATEKQSKWMFCLPAPIDGRHGIDLIVSSKGARAMVGWLEAPADPRQLDQWKLHQIREAGWIMSLRLADIDNDGDQDIITSDRKGPRRGCHWLENPGPVAKQKQPWKQHAIGTGNREVMFLDYADFDGDGLRDVVVPSRPGEILLHRRLPGKRVTWQTSKLPFPSNVGLGKSATVADINGDTQPDIVLSFEHSQDRSGLVGMLRKRKAKRESWQQQEISGPVGTKFDLVKPYDIDGDGDLDLLTCEERENLGVIWYENPQRQK